MRLFLHWDMEGTSGLFRRDQVWFWEPGVSEEAAREGRELLTAEVNAASRAALEAGADSLVVCDTHHGGGNLLADELLDDARITYLLRSVGEQDGRRRWMPWLDERVDGLLLMGHHAKAGTPNAFLPHTWSTQWTDFRINGRSVGEIGIESCYAGHWNIPLLLVHGDEAACAETHAQHPGTLTAGVKRALSNDRAEGPSPEDARRLTGEKIAEALRAPRPAPFRPRLPMRVEIEMTTAEAAERIAPRPGVERVDERTVAGVVDAHADVVKWALGAGLDMEPA